MTSVIVVLVIAALIALLARGAVPFLDRMLGIMERRVAIEEQRAERPVSHKIEPPPVNLLQHAFRESEPWAREQAVQAMFEAYENSGRDWSKVQNMVAIRDMGMTS